MKKIINEPDDFVDEVIEGMLAAHPELRAASPDLRAVVRADAPRPGKVGLVIGGGSGHLPVFAGYLGPGLCDGVAIGNVFSSPSADQVYAATTAVSGGAGVLYLYGNYGGDIYNFDLAGDMALADGIRTATVLATDDVASAGPAGKSARRGVAGMALTFKIAGAAAERGDDLDQVAAIARRANDRTATMGVGLSPTILPAAGEPTFSLGDGEMEIGIGIHGEPGVHRGKLEPADAIADRLTGEILQDLGIGEGGQVAVLVNGLGATPLEELYVLYRRVQQLLAERRIVIHRPLVGNFVTSLEMAGASVSILALDPELTALLDAPARTPLFDHWTAFSPDQQPRAAARRSATGRQRYGPPGEPSHLSAILRDLMPRLRGHADQLRQLDGMLGDGDLGVTITAGSTVVEDVAERFAAATDAQLLHEAGIAFAAANPSTFAALVGGGIIAAAAQLSPESRLDGLTLPSFARAVTSRVAERGGAQPGDKTVLDVLLVSLRPLDEADRSDSPLTVLARVRAAAEAENARLTGQRSARGRAAWLGERSAGLQDPGMAAYLAFLDELQAVLEDASHSTADMPPST
jgi:D-erythrulose 4-kinase